jgi:hypothetical protein
VLPVPPTIDISPPFPVVAAPVANEIFPELPDVLAPV